MTLFVPRQQYANSLILVAVDEDELPIAQPSYQVIKAPRSELGAYVLMST